MLSNASARAATSAILTGGYDALSELGLCRVRFAPSLHAGQMPAFRRRAQRARAGRRRGPARARKFRRRQGARRGNSGRNHRLRHLHRQSSPHPAASFRDRAAARRWSARCRARSSRRTTIDYINAHGTATPFNDAAEGHAIAELFGRVPVSSTKGMMGHSLGAAGAIEAVITLLALRNGFLPANINFRAPDVGLDLDIVANKLRAADAARWRFRIPSASAAPTRRSCSGAPDESAPRRPGMGHAARRARSTRSGKNFALATSAAASTVRRRSLGEEDFHALSMCRRRRLRGSRAPSATPPLERDLAFRGRGRTGGAARRRAGARRSERGANRARFSRSRTAASFTPGASITTS